MTLVTPIRLGILACLYGLTMAAAQTPANPPAPKAIESIEFRGLSAVTQDAMKTTIGSKAGDIFNEASMRRDLTALWKTNRFEDVQVKTETGARGGIVVRFIVTERK